MRTPYIEPIRKKRYGITNEHFQLMHDAQGGLCAICHKPPKEKLVIDHCRATSRVRGLLCGQCNVALGMVKEDIAILESMIEYIRNECHV